MVREQMCQRALTERQTLGSGGALQRRHSASLEPLAQRNDAVSVGNELSIVVVVPTNTVVTEPGGSKRSTQCQWALTQKQTFLGGGALKRGHGAPFERLAQLGDALGGVGTLDFTISILVVAAERVAGQAVSMTKEECQWALTERRTLGRRRTSAP